MEGRSLTIKQRRFLREYIKTGNGTKAALVAYDTDDPVVAHAIAAENLQKRAIQKAVQEMLDAAMITERKLGEILVHYLGLYAADDWKLRSLGLKALDMAFRITGAYAPERHQRHLEEIFRGWTQEELLHYAETAEWPDHMAGRICGGRFRGLRDSEEIPA